MDKNNMGSLLNSILLSNCNQRARGEGMLVIICPSGPGNIEQHLSELCYWLNVNFEVNHCILISKHDWSKIRFLFCRCD
eukprot:c28794_g1_i1 orf=1-234(-)